MTDQQIHPLTEFLKQVGEETVQNHDQSASRLEMLARLTWDFVLDGRVRFSRGDFIMATPASWVATVKWLYVQLLGRQQPAARPASKESAPPAFLAEMLKQIDAESAPPLNRHQRRAAATQRR